MVRLTEIESFLENPSALTQVSETLQRAIAQSPETPKELLEILVKSDYSDVREAAQLHINWTENVPENPRQAVTEQLKNHDLGQNDHLAVELLKIAPVPPFFFSKWVPPRYFIEGLENPYLPHHYRIEFLEILAEKPIIEARLTVAESSDTPQYLLEKLAGDLEKAVRLTIEYNPNTPLALIRLVKNQQKIASDWDADPKQLSNLGKSQWEWIRLTVAQNPSTPIDTLQELAQDKCSVIQLAVVKNPVIPSSILHELAKHSRPEIRVAVATHPNTNEETLHDLFIIPSREFAAIQSRKNLPRSIIERLFELENTTPVWKAKSKRSWFFKQPNTPLWILEQFADVDLATVEAEKLARQSKLDIVKEWVAKELEFLAEIASHPQVSIELLEHLAQYPSPKVQLAVAENVKTPEALRLSLFRFLINVSDDRILVKIAENINTPTEILEQMAIKYFTNTSVLKSLKFSFPNIPKSVFEVIETFVNEQEQPPGHLFLGLGEDPAFQGSMLNRWRELLESLNPSEKEIMQQLSQTMMGFVGLSLSVPNRQWLRKGLSSPESMLYGILLLLAMAQGGNAKSRGKLIVALIGNPNLSLATRQGLKQDVMKNPGNDAGYFLLSLLLAPNQNHLTIQTYLEKALNSKTNLKTLAKHPKTPAYILEKFLERKQDLEALAENPNTPSHLLRQIFQKTLEKRNDYLRNEVARNPNLPLDILKQLASQSKHNALMNPRLNNIDRYEITLNINSQQEEKKALEIIAQRPNNPLKLREKIPQPSRYSRYVRKVEPERFTDTPTLNDLPCIYDPSIDHLCDVLGEYALSNNQFIRFVTLLHPETPRQILEKAAKSRFWWERYAVADNPKTRSETRELLKQDANSIVRGTCSLW